MKKIGYKKSYKKSYKEIDMDIQEILLAYKAYFKQNGFSPAAPQLVAMNDLARVRHEVMASSSFNTQNYLFKLSKSLFRPYKYTQGLYLWGEVGRGKTFLMDMFYQLLPLPEGEKTRYHFQNFMQMVHAKLHGLSKSEPNLSDPLIRIAKDMAKTTKVICFDEFIVVDIADAMVLGALFGYLFSQKITIICTSNLPPDRLYEYGLQRASFLPAIAKIKQNMQVLNVNSGVDYRREGSGFGKYQYYLFTQNSAEQKQALEVLKQYFLANAKHPKIKQMSIDLNGRKLQCKAKSGNIIWFSFDKLCGYGRSADDYISLADQYHTIILDGLGHMDDSNNDPARRFIQLIDQWYDRGKNIYIQASVELDKIYTGNLLSFEFDRTYSRLIEQNACAIPLL